MASPLLTMGLGLALLCAGRRLFWLFVGAVGFFAAMHFVAGYLGEEHRDWAIAASLIAGGAGAVPAIFVQKAAVGIAGAATGAYLLDQFFRDALGEYPPSGWVLIVAAAILGALLLMFLFRWALIVITSLAGAHLFLATVPLPVRWLAVAYAALFVAGLALQSRSGRPNST